MIVKVKNKILFKVTLVKKSEHYTPAPIQWRLRILRLADNPHPAATK